MVKENAYVSIQAFMINELHLKGNELIVYAVIHGFTQDGQHWYYGTRGHLAEWCGATKGTVSNCLKSLLRKGYIRRREVERFGNVEVQYQAVTEFDTPLSKIDTPHIKNCDTPISKIDSIDKLEDNDNVKPNNNGFKPPTIEDVKEHVKKKGYHFSAERFFDYYESSGWRKANGKKVSNWKQCCATWEGRAGNATGNEVIWDAELREYADALGF